MEENREQSEQEMQEQILKKEGYTPRPRWQIVAAWVGAAIVAAGFLLYCWQIANVGA